MHPECICMHLCGQRCPSHLHGVQAPCHSVVHHLKPAHICCTQQQLGHEVLVSEHLPTRVGGHVSMFRHGILVRESAHGNLRVSCMRRDGEWREVAPRCVCDRSGVHHVPPRQGSPIPPPSLPHISAMPPTLSCRSVQASSWASTTLCWAGRLAPYNHDHPGPITCTPYLHCSNSIAQQRLQS